MRRWSTLMTLLILSLASPMTWLAGAAQEGDPAAEASAAAIELSRFEANGDYASLVELLHPDAEAIIPLDVVTAWYAEEFAPRDAGEITQVTDVQFIDWTWPVNGKTYPETAEITFEQPYGGVAEIDTIHLVEFSGAWRWFFGVSLEGANSVIESYAPAYPAVQADPTTAVLTDDGRIPWGLEGVTTVDLTEEQITAALPPEIAGHTLREEPEEAREADVSYVFAANSTTYSYEDADDPAMTAGGLTVSRLPTDLSVPQALEEIRSSETSPIDLDDFLRVNLEMQDSSEGSVPFLLYRQTADEAVGEVTYLVWGATDGAAIYTATARDLAHLRLLAEGIAAGLGGEGSGDFS